jgi:predicted dienelactone hydrolase
MILSDWLMLAALAIFLLVWWLRPSPARRKLLWGAAAVALVAGLWGVLDYRWQAGAGGVVALVLLLVMAISARRKRERQGVPYISGSLFALLTLVAAAPLYLFPVPDIPRPDGPHAVGTRTFELTDDSRTGIFLAGADEGRRLLVRVWYPAVPGAGGPRAPYFTDREAGATARGLGGLFGFAPMLGYLKHVRTNAVVGTPVAASETALPTVFFSHGYVMFAGQNIALMEHLASHGYVVYAVQHTYDASDTVFPNGDIAPLDQSMMTQASDERVAAETADVMKGDSVDVRLDGHIRGAELLHENGARIAAESAPVWVADKAFVLDSLQSGDVPREVADVVAASDLSRTGHVGMSFGGSTTGAFCLADSRCAAGINMDGLSYHAQTLGAGMPVPFLMLNGDLDRAYRLMSGEAPSTPRSFNEFSYEDFARAGQRDDIYRLQIKGALHLAFSDFTLFVRQPASEEMLGSTPAGVMIGAQNALVRGFFDRHLRGAANGFPAPQIKQFEGWISPVGNSAVRDWWLSLSQAERDAFEARLKVVQAKGVSPDVLTGF